MITPPAIGAVIRSLYSILPLRMSEKATEVSTVAEMQYNTLIPALE